MKPRKTKHCPKCTTDLPLDNFSSTRAKYCESCKRIRQLEQARERNKRQLERLKNKKRKTKTVVSIADLKKQVQRKVNAYIRKRDKDEPCISCLQYKDNKDAGHFLAQGSYGLLRYNFDNLHGQCVSCNRFKHGNLLEYRMNLVCKIGLERVLWLEEHRHETKQWTREELYEIAESVKRAEQEL